MRNAAYEQGFRSVLPMHLDAGKPCGGGHIAANKQCKAGQGAAVRSPQHDLDEEERLNEERENALNEYDANSTAANKRRLAKAHQAYEEHMKKTAPARRARHRQQTINDLKKGAAPAALIAAAAGLAAATYHPKVRQKIAEIDKGQTERAAQWKARHQRTKK